MRPPPLLRPMSRRGLWQLWPLLALAAILAAAAWLPEAEAAKGVRRVRRKKVTTPNLAPPSSEAEAPPKEEVHRVGVPPDLGEGESAKQRSPKDGRG